MPERCRGGLAPRRFATSLALRSPFSHIFSMTVQASRAHPGRFPVFFLAAGLLLATCTRTESVTRAPSCPPELFSGPVGTPFTTPPALKDVADARRDYRRRLSDVGVGPESPLEPYRIHTLIDTEGVVVLAVAEPSTGDPVLDSAVVRAARALEYLPGKLEGVPVCVWLGVSGLTGVN